VDDPTIRILAETESYSIWASDEPDGEITYHLELGSVTVHLFREELDEVIALLTQAEDRVGQR
jgi:hypothetical protein